MTSSGGTCGSGALQRFRGFLARQVVEAFRCDRARITDLDIGHSPDRRAGRVLDLHLGLNSRESISDRGGLAGDPLRPDDMACLPATGPRVRGMDVPLTRDESTPALVGGGAGWRPHLPH